MSRLGAGPVQVDGGVVGRVLVCVALVALAVTSVLLFAAGADKNAAIARLHQQAVPVEMTVGGCRGLLGGSGSNPVGYACWGSFALAGRSYREGIPGDALLAPGERLAMLTVPGDPALVDTSRALSAERTSSTVYVLPGVLSAVFLGALALLAGYRRAGRRQPGLRSPLGLAGRARRGVAAGGV